MGIRQVSCTLKNSSEETDILFSYTVLIDFSYRGDEFDFMTTTPPAIISKMIIYMSEGSLTTNQLLMAIQEYLNGLDNIIMPDKLGSIGGNQ